MGNHAGSKPFPAVAVAEGEDRSPKFWPHFSTRSRVMAYCFAAAVVALLAGAVIYPRFHPQVEPLTLSPVPFTAYGGTETMPAFSPDGSQIAFTWDGDLPPGSKGFHLYVKVI